MRLVLERFAGFASDEIRVITDEDAKKSDIEEHIEWLVKDASPGDLLFLHFSGHGSQVRDTDEEDEPLDHLDEILCPFDMAWDGTFITDDYLRRRLEVPAGVVLEVILDACHTGSSEGEAVVAPAATATNEQQARFLEPPAGTLTGTEHFATTRLLRAPMVPRVALWSACGAAQTASDARINGLFNGAFTFYFCKHMRELPGILRRDLLSRVRKSLADAGYSQVPELAAPPELAAARPFHL
jgi:hypothetical protein